MKYLKLSILFIFTLLCFQCDPPKPYGDLYVLIRDESGDLVQGCEVKLYETENDFINETNQVGNTSTTDENGRAFFLDLDEGTYYVSAVYVDTNDVEKNNLLVSTAVDVFATEIGYRNSITVIIWNSFLGNMTAADGKHWAYNRYVDVASGVERPVPECLEDDQLIFYRNGDFKYVSEQLNCEEGEDDSFEGYFTPVSNGSFIIITDTLEQQKLGFYVVSATADTMIAQFGNDFIYYNAVNE